MFQCFIHTIIAGTIPIVFVGSLYIVERELRGNHPLVLRKRFGAVSVVCALSIVTAYIILRAFNVTDYPLEHMGFHWYGTIASIFFPVLLTSIFYLGSLIILYLDGSFKLLLSVREWRRAINDVQWIRHTIMGPVSEEVAFRACSTALLIPCASFGFIVFFWPLFFSFSHLHHIRDDLRNGLSLKSALSYRIFQLAYTYLFGVYATYIFLQTRHIIAPILVHSLCNTIGLPLFDETSHYTGKLNKFLWVTHIFGFILWISLLPYLMTPALYKLI
jgi:prenyl protein peptidase